MDCLFCKIAKQEIPSKVIYEDENCFAFHDIDPQAPVHFLVIPKEHHENLAEMSQKNPEALAKIMEKIPEIAKSLGETEFRLVSNNGAKAGQTVFHLHFHVLAGRDLGWPPG